jgi:hypothetical protein
MVSTILSLPLKAFSWQKNINMNQYEFSEEKIKAINEFPVKELVTKGLTILQILQETNYILDLQDTITEKDITALEKTFFGTEKSEFLNKPASQFFCKYLYPLLMLYNTKSFLIKSESLKVASYTISLQELRSIKKSFDNDFIVSNVFYLMNNLCNIHSKKLNPIITKRSTIGIN